MTTEEHLNKIMAKCRELISQHGDGFERHKAGWHATMEARALLKTVGKWEESA